MFKETYILTYLFDGQIQKYYYDYHGVQYEKKSVVKENGRYELVDYFMEDRSKYKGLISIYKGKLNDIGEDDNALSVGWFEKNSKPRKDKLKNNLYNFFRHIMKAKSDEILWTTFKDYSDSKKGIAGKGFSKKAPKNAPDKEGKACFIPWTTRATNVYKHKSVLAFCVNRFVNPSDKEFFAQRGVEIDEEMLALSDMLQWIFRSRIREGQPIEIYTPSKRMRALLYKWLDGEL